MKRLIFIIFLLIPVTSSAATFYLDTRLQTQVRENVTAEREVPFDTYFDAGMADLPYNGSFDVSLRNNRVFNIEHDEFDLYQTVFRMNNIGGWFDFSAGRQFISPGFHTYLMDGLSMTFGEDDWPILIGLFSGIPRYIETGDFHGEIGLVSGITAELQGFKNYYMKLSLVYDTLDIDDANWKEDDTILVGLSSYKQFSAKAKPTLYTDIEYDTAGNAFETGLLGFSLEPHQRVYWNIEGGYFDTNRARQRTTIFGLYGSDMFYQARTGLAITAVEDSKGVKDLVFNVGYGFQRLKVQSPLDENAHLVDSGFGMTISPARMDLGATYTFYDSFGGRAHDIYGYIHEQPFDIWGIELGAGYAKYSKVTNDNDTAISVLLMTDVEVVKDLVLSAGGEYLRNNIFSNEWRFNGVISYRLDHKI